MLKQSSSVSVWAASWRRDKGRISRAGLVVARLLGAASALLLLISTPARSQDYWSNTGSGDWSNPSNWISNSVPAEGTDAYIVNGGTAMLTQPNETCGTLTLGNSAGSGAVEMANGNLSLYNVLILGNDLGSSGTYVLSGSSQLSFVQVLGVLSTEIVGNSGTGRFVQSGGANECSMGQLVLGSQIGGSGTYYLIGGQLNAGEVVGYSGSGTFIQSGGNNSCGLTIGLNGSGSYLLQGNGQLSENLMTIGFGGSGTFTQTGGTVSGGYLLAGYPGGAGTYNLSGSTSLLTGGETVGRDGIGMVTQTGGTNAASGLYIGIGNWPMPSGTGTYDLSGGYLSCTPYPFYLGNGKGGSGTFSLSGGQMSASVEYVGNAATGTFTQSGGTNSVAGGLYIYSGAFSPTWAYSGTYNLNGGLLSINALYPPSGSGNGAFNFNGGTLLASASFSTGMPMTLGTSGSGATFDTAGYCVALAGPLSGLGGLTKTDSGALILAATNSYTGNTLIEGGTLLLESPLALQNSTLDTSGAGSLSFGSLSAVTIGGLTGPGSLALRNTVSAPVALAVGNNSSTYPGALIGPGSLIKVGTGTLTLTGSNTYAGPTIINQGELLVSGWLLSPATLINGGVLTLANSAAMPNSGSIFFGGGTLRYSGSNTVDYSAEIVSSPGPISIDTNGANITFASSLASSNNGGLTKIGNGTLTLAASNSYTGTTTIVGGILSLANSAAVPSSGNITFGGGTLQYGASNTQDYSGSIVGSTGPISIDTNNADIIFASSLASSNTGGLTKIGSGTLTLVAVNSFSGNALISGGTLVLGNPLALENSTLDTSGLGVLSFGSLSAATLGGLSGPATLALSSSACSSLVLRVGNNGADTTFSGTLTGAGSLIKVGSGSLLLSGSNIYTGGTALNCGVLSLANAAALPGGGSITFGGGTLQYSGSNSVDYSGSIVGSTGPLSIDTNGTNVTFASALGNSNTSGLTKIGSGTLLLLASNAYTGSTTISGGTLQIGNGGSGASIADTSGLLDNGALAFNHSDAVTFSPSISGSGTLTQAGSGVLTLAGSNPYSGQTTISAGAVSLNNANSVQNSTVTVNVNSGLLFNSNSGAIATYNVGGLAGNGNISLADGSYAIALSVGGNGASTSYSGALSGAGSLIKFGSGDLVLSASNSYTGSTTLSGGSLQVGNGGTGASIASTSSVVDNGSLVFDHSDAVSFSPRISGAGGLTQTGPGVLTLTGSNTYAGRTTVSAGAISLNNANAVQNSTVTVIPNDGLLFNSNSGAIATYNIGGLAGNGNISLADGSYAIALSVGGNGASTTYGGAIGGSGGLNKIGSGTLTLTRPNAYAGPTAVEAGDLKLLSAATGAIGIQFMGLGSAIGAARNGVFNMTNWNSFIGTTLGSQSGALKDSNGNATSAVLNSFYGTNPWKTGSSVPLLNGYLDNTGGTDTVTISNIPYAYYNVIAYFGSDVAGREGSVELSTAGATYYYKAEGNTTSYVRTTSTNGTYVPANYAVWSGVSGGSLTISQQLGTGFQNNGLNGIQIVGANGSVLPTSTALTIAANATLDLGGVQQQVASLSDYTPGSGGSIVNSATSASVLTLSPTGGSTTFSGTIIGGGTLGAISLVMSGSGTQLLAGSMIGPGSLTANSGTLILSGSNTYAGGTTVEGGTLAITTGNALPVNGSLTIGAGGMFIFDPMATAAPFASTGVSVSAVPEPSTLALLGAVAIGLLTCARRRRKPTAC